MASTLSFVDFSGDESQDSPTYRIPINGLGMEFGDAPADMRLMCEMCYKMKTIQMFSHVRHLITSSSMKDRQHTLDIMGQYYPGISNVCMICFHDFANDVEICIFDTHNPKSAPTKHTTEDQPPRNAFVQQFVAQKILMRPMKNYLGMTFNDTTSECDEFECDECVRLDRSRTVHHVSDMGYVRTLVDEKTKEERQQLIDMLCEGKNYCDSCFFFVAADVTKNLSTREKKNYQIE